MERHKYNVFVEALGDDRYLVKHKKDTVAMDTTDLEVIQHLNDMRITSIDRVSGVYLQTKQTTGEFQLQIDGR